MNHLETQAVNPLTHPNEMDASLPQLLARLNASPAYRGRFYRAFADSVATTPRLLKALAQFTVSLESSNSKYDKYVRHEPGGEFTDQELNGLTLFRASCASCHREPLFTNQGFANKACRLIHSITTWAAPPSPAAPPTATSSGCPPCAASS